MTAYYNEHDPKAAAWLRELIREGHIADGVVDERSIVDVQPADLAGFTQCHFFAGIGGWSLALRLAGWPDDRPVWTGSCPCQPFSDAGQKGGTEDARHLWPEFYRLIRECGPPVIFGEQVASKDGLAWLDIVSTDLERALYAFGAADLCAAGVGAPHMRQRLYFVADNYSRRWAARRHDTSAGHGASAAADCGVGDVADTGSERWERWPDTSGSTGEDAPERCEGLRDAESRGVDGELADTDSRQRGRRSSGPGESTGADAVGTPELGRRIVGGCSEGSVADTDGRDASTEGLQRSGQHGQQPQNSWTCEWIPCSDGKARPVEPGTFPLAHGVPHRVGLLRGYGNAIVPEVAQVFIEAYLA